MRMCRGVPGKFHDEVVHDEAICPLCDALDKLADMTAKADGFQARLLVEELRADHAEDALAEK